MVNLTALDLGGTKIRTLDVLANCRNLKVLNCSGVEVLEMRGAYYHMKITGSLDPLANCTKLETLILIGCEALTGTSSLSSVPKTAAVASDGRDQHF